MNGDAGNDMLLGGEGNDLLDGGLDGAPQTDAFIQDSDRLDGGNGIDTASYSQVQHGMFVNLFQGLAFGKGNVDTLISIENVTGTNFVDSIVGDNNANGIQGAGGSDRLDGEGGNDFLSGSTGNDTLIGGAGDDKMFGGSDADKFVFELASDSGKGLGNRDVITGFERSIDKLDLSQIDAKAGTRRQPGLHLHRRQRVLGRGPGARLLRGRSHRRRAEHHGHQRGRGADRACRPHRPGGDRLHPLAEATFGSISANWPARIVPGRFFRRVD